MVLSCRRGSEAFFFRTFAISFFLFFAWDNFSNPRLATVERSEPPSDAIGVAIYRVQRLASGHGRSEQFRDFFFLSPHSTILP